MCEFCSVSPFSAKSEQYEVVNECNKKRTIHFFAQRFTTFLGETTMHCTFTFKLYFVYSVFFVNRCANKCIVLFLLHTHSQHRIVHFLQKTVKPNRTHTLPGPPLFTNCSLFASCTSTTTPRVDLEKRFLNSGDYQTS